MLSMCLCVSLRYSSEECFPANLRFFEWRRFQRISQEERERERAFNREQQLYKTEARERVYFAARPAFLTNSPNSFPFNDDIWNEYTCINRVRE